MLGLKVPNTFRDVTQQRQIVGLMLQTAIVAGQLRLGAQALVDLGITAVAEPLAARRRHVDIVAQPFINTVDNRFRRFSRPDKRVNQCSERFLVFGMMRCQILQHAVFEFVNLSALVGHNCRRRTFLNDLFVFHGMIVF